MSTAHALNFIRNFETDTQLRKLCNSCKTKDELLYLLTNKGLSFTTFEFEEVINALLVKCQTYEQAGYIKNINDWFKLFR